MKSYGIKIMLAILFIVVSLFLTNDLGVIKIEKTAIITAIAIDEKDGNIVVSAQVALPKATDSAADEDSLISGEGKTIGLAIDDIAIKTGWYPKLAFCNLIIVNHAIADEYLPEIVNYVLYSKKIYDSILIAYSEESAKKVLEATGSLDNVSSFSIQKILLKNADDANAVYYSRVKDIAISLTSESKQSLIPLIKLSEQVPRPPATGGSEEKPSYIFDASTTMLLSHGKIVGQLNTEQTLFYNLIVKGVKEIYFEVPYDTDKTALLKIVDSKSKTKIKPSDKGASLDISLSLNVYLIDVKSGKIFDTENSNIVPKRIITSAEEKITKEIESLVEISKSCGCDYFEIKENLFRYHPSFYKKHKDTLTLDKITAKIKVDVKSLDKKR